MPIVPSTVVTTGGDGGGETPNAFSLLVTLLATEKLQQVSAATVPQDESEAKRVRAIREELLTQIATDAPASHGVSSPPAPATSPGAPPVRSERPTRPERPERSDSSHASPPDASEPGVAPKG